MYAVILAGGSGTRLWPLSRAQFPKQYLSLGRDRQSLFQASITRALVAVPAENILVVTHRDQSDEIKRQLALSGLQKIKILQEPLAQNTAPAVGFAAWYLLRHAGSAAVMAVLPSDHLIPDHDLFAATLLTGERAAAEYGLVTFGIRPTYPETGYGYIQCGVQLNTDAYRVGKFVEKPRLEKAQAYLKDPRYLWNSGMFVFQVGALIAQYRQQLPHMATALDKIDYDNFTNLEEIYTGLQKISIDYGILERAANVTVIPTAVNWSDVGSWEAYYQVSAKDEAGNLLQGRVLSEDTKNSMILAQSRLIGAVGLEDMVVVETDDALLVCSRHRTQDVKKIVDRLQLEEAPEARQHTTVYRPWGSFTSLEMGETYQVKRINVNPGARLSLQSHRHRSEHWVVVSGEAFVTVDDRQIAVKKGESIFIPQGARHRMENKGIDPLALIEVQNGSYLGEDDIERYEDDYGRTETRGRFSRPAGGPGHGDVSLVPPETRGRFSRPAAASGNETRGRFSRPAGASGNDLPQVHSDTPDATSLARQHYNHWLSQAALDAVTRSALLSMEGNDALILDHFGSELAFGTGGIRGLIGPGRNRVNCYTIRRATQGLADYLRSLPDAGSPKKVAIAYDTRHHSREYAEATALVLAANGIGVLLFTEVRPTPALSFATRVLGCAAGIMITASHNSFQYNGYKVYGPDGGQAVSPLVDDLAMAIGNVDIFQDVRTMLWADAFTQGLLEIIGPDLDRNFLEAASAVSLTKPNVRLKVVYSPLHGAGAVYIPGLLGQSGYVDVLPVEAQMAPDPNFSTVRVPNPEDPASLTMAIALAETEKADLVLATDPDGDRVGTAVRAVDGSYVILSGNAVGALLIDYICSRLSAQNKLLPNSAIIKTIVTGRLGQKVAAAYGLHTIETLTGFKFIGAEVTALEATGAYNFIFGYEESYGYLAGTFVRDKDAVSSSLLIAEMTAYYKEQGLTLPQVLERLYQKHGYFREDLINIELQELADADNFVHAYENLPPEIAGVPIIEKRDYNRRTGWELPTGRMFPLTLPQSPVLHFTLADESWFAVRPSGTEPKIKIYLSVNAPDAAEADAKLARLREAILGIKRP